MNFMRRLAGCGYQQGWGVEAASGGSICTTSKTWIPIPQAKIIFDFPKAEEITFEGRAIEESDGSGLVRVEIGLRVDGIDYRGSRDWATSGQTMIAHSVDKKIPLAKGLHEAELIFRALGDVPGSLYLLPSWPVSLEAWY